jgi:hypothetical protein
MLFNVRTRKPFNVTGPNFGSAPDENSDASVKDVRGDVFEGGNNEFLSVNFDAFVNHDNACWCDDDAKNCFVRVRKQTNKNECQKKQHIVDGVGRFCLR